nr:hypothetical protein C18A3.6 - Caenorhabditis elegans [Caenorhabditis elegans]
MGKKEKDDESTTSSQEKVKKKDKEKVHLRLKDKVKKLRKSKSIAVSSPADYMTCQCEPCKKVALEMAAGGQPQGATPGQPDQNFDYMFKLLIIGNSSVGKTSFLFRYCDDSFTSAFVSTVGIDFKVKTVFRGDKRVKLQIWDTAGQERYRTITTAYYRGAMGFILMYDITNEESFNSVQDWCTQIKTYSWENAQVVLVGNKCDMDSERVVSMDRGRQLADQLGLEFFETSAKENINVKAVFEKLVEIICDKMAERPTATAKRTEARSESDPKACSTAMQLLKILRRSWFNYLFKSFSLSLIKFSFSAIFINILTYSNVQSYSPFVKNQQFLSTLPNNSQSCVF